VAESLNEAENRIALFARVASDCHDTNNFSIDSGFTNNMCSKKVSLKEMKKHKGIVKVANGQTIRISVVGTYTGQNKEHRETVSLKEVLVIQKVAAN
jgi:hypothetical protein